MRKPYKTRYFSTHWTRHFVHYQLTSNWSSDLPNGSQRSYFAVINLIRTSFIERTRKWKPFYENHLRFQTSLRMFFITWHICDLFLFSLHSKPNAHPLNYSDSLKRFFIFRNTHTHSHKREENQEQEKKKTAANQTLHPENHIIASNFRKKPFKNWPTP